MKTIKSIKTSEGEFQIDYNGLANLPDNTNVPEGFLPHGTVVSVELDGSGDFTSLEDAVAFLSGKWSNGTVSIQLGEGVFEIENEIVIPNSIHFNQFYIQGAGMDKTIIHRSVDVSGEGALYVYLKKATPVFIANLTIDIDSSEHTDIRAIRLYGGAFIDVSNVKVSGALYGISCTGGAHTTVRGTLSAENCTNAILCGGAKVSFCVSAKLICVNCTRGLYVTHGGHVVLYQAKYSATNTPTLTSQAIGTATASGWITGSWTQV